MKYAECCNESCSYFMTFKSFNHKSSDSFFVTINKHNSNNNINFKERLNLKLKKLFLLWFCE